MPVPSPPIDLRGHLAADLQHREVGVGCRHVHDLAGLRAFARVDDAHFGTAGRAQHPGIARLATAVRVEDGAVEEDTARFGKPEDRGAALLEVGIFTEQAIGGHVGIFWLGRNVRKNSRRHTFSYGTLRLDRRSSHSGTGKRFSRKNAGLNSFD